MLFNSFSYAIFLPIVFIVYWILPQRHQWILLLLASYYFYMCWYPKYIVLIVFTTLVSYVCGILLEKNNRKWMRRSIVIIVAFICIGILFVFKYYNFAVNAICRFFPMPLRTMNLLLPVGISFYTFQTLSYVIDVYQGDCHAEKNIGVYAAFVSFFPQLVAGPIERANNLLPQIREKHSFIATDCYYGIRLIAWGLFKKVLIADNFAVYVDIVYGDIYTYTGCSILIASFCFAIQIYCDFSGYSDIARGSARLFGIGIMENFRSPYFSTSIKDFWSRWHISLSSWFRDYLYIPMGGNRVSKLRNILNIMITFLVSGLWHGAGWNFVAWGCIHGLAQIFENIFEIKRSKNGYDLYSWIRRCVIFTFVTFTWIFFRANNIREALYAIKAIWNGISNVKIYCSQGLNDLGMDMQSILLLLLYIVPLATFDFCSLKIDPIEWMGKKCRWLHHFAIIMIIFVLLFWGYVGQSTFVYFQF